MSDAALELAAIVESSLDAIIGQDTDGIITSWNAGAERIYGYGAPEVIGRHVSLIIPDDQQAEYDGLLERTRRGETISHYEAIRRRKDGSVLQVSVTLSPTRDASGEIVGVSIIARDITERKRLQEQLARSEKRAAMGELVSGIAHEINNPLASVLLNAQLLEMHPDPQVREDAAAIREMTERASRVVRYLLAIARDNEQVRSTCSVRSLIDTSLKICGYRLSVAGIALHVRLADALPMIEANANQIQQVLLNLIGNAEQALRSRDAHRSITVSADATESEGRRWVRIAVADNGCGMPPEVRERIFDAFFTTREIGEAAGLGLSICRGIVSAHEGSIDVASREGEGTVFTVLLPAARGRDESTIGVADYK